MLERLGYRIDKRVTDSAVAAGCGVRRWDGYAMHDDWHLGRVVAAIRSAAELPGESSVADALAAVIAKQQERERVTARKRKQEETEAARRQEEEAVISGLRVELRALRATDPGMGLLPPLNISPLTLPTGLFSTDVVVLRIGASVAWVKTTPVFWRSLHQSPRISPSLSAGHRRMGFSSSRRSWHHHQMASLTILSLNHFTENMARAEALNTEIATITNSSMASSPTPRVARFEPEQSRRRRKG